MSISIPTNPPAKTDVSSSDDIHASAKADATKQRLDAKNKLNVSIMEASLEVSITSQNDSLSLLFKTAIDGINKVLQPTLGENAIQAATSQDNSPEGTAGRIVSLSTAFFDAFKKNHVGEDSAGVLKLFMDSLHSGFEKGFKEATDILTGLQVFKGDIASNIDKTHELVLKGFADFEAAQMAQLTAAAVPGQSVGAAENPVSPTAAEAATSAATSTSTAASDSGGTIWKN